MPDSSDEQIWRHLAEYGDMPTASLFSRAFYQLMAEYATHSANTEASRELLAKFLNREVRYHRQVGRFTDAEAVPLEDLQSVAGKRIIALHDLIEQAKAALSQTAAGEITRQLLLAECYYHIEEPDKAVAHLEMALKDGADDPLIYFVLGYNRYRLAVQSFATITATAERPHYDVSFQRACLQAVAAFEDALTGEDSDRQVYQWIGHVLETAGFDEAASHAFEKAEGFLPVESDSADLGFPVPEANDHPSSRRELSSAAPITDAEIERVRELLKRPHQISELWPEDEAGADSTENL